MKKNFYEFVINECPIGYAYYRIILDPNNSPSDYEFLDVNSKFEEYIGLKSIDLLGEKITEIFPTISKGEKNLIRTYGNIALSGGSKEIEEFSQILKGRYKIKICSPKKNYFITYISSIKDRKYKSNNREKLKKKISKFLIMNIVQKYLKIQNKNMNFFLKMLLNLLL